MFRNVPLDVISLTLPELADPLGPFNTPVPSFPTLPPISSYSAGGLSSLFYPFKVVLPDATFPLWVSNRTSGRLNTVVAPPPTAYFACSALPARVTPWRRRQFRQCRAPPPPLARVPYQPFLYPTLFPTVSQTSVSVPPKTRKILDADS